MTRPSNANKRPKVDRIVLLDIKHGLYFPSTFFKYILNPRMIKSTTINQNVLRLKKYTMLSLFTPMDTKKLRFSSKVNILVNTTNSNAICKGILNSLSNFITLHPISCIY